MTKKIPNWIWIAGIIILVLFVNQSGMLLSTTTEDFCPAVCVEMWEISTDTTGEDTCIINECGSGCGPDGINSFSTEESCNAAIGDCPEFVRNLPTKIGMEQDCNAGVLMIIFGILIIFALVIIFKR